MKLLMIDNYDSFTYNIVQYFGELGADVEVFRNDEITLEGIAARNPDRLVISPGPCSPNEAGISVQAIQHFMGKLPILGGAWGGSGLGCEVGIGQHVSAFGGRLGQGHVSVRGEGSQTKRPHRAVCGLERGDQTGGRNARDRSGD